MRGRPLGPVRSTPRHPISTGSSRGIPTRRDRALFNLGPFFHRSFDEIRSRLRGERLGIAVRKAWADLIARGGATIVLFALYAFLAYLTIRGQVSLGTLVMCLQAIQRGFGHLTAVGENVARLYENHLFLTHLHELLAVGNAVVDPAKPRERVPRAAQGGYHLRACLLSVPERECECPLEPQPDDQASGAHRPRGAKRGGEDDTREAPVPPL